MQFAQWTTLRLSHLSLTTDVIEAVVSTSLNTQQLEHEIPVNIKDTLYSDQYSTSISQTKQQGGEYSETNGCSKHSVVHFEHTEQEDKYSQWTGTRDIPLLNMSTHTHKGVVNIHNEWALETCRGSVWAVKTVHVKTHSRFVVFANLWAQSGRIMVTAWGCGLGHGGCGSQCLLHPHTCSYSTQGHAASVVLVLLMLLVLCAGDNVTNKRREDSEGVSSDHAHHSCENK